jgi:hypothetical protein
MYDYKNPRELLTKVSGVMVIDLVDKIPLLEDFVQTIKPLEEGIYDAISNKLIFSPSKYSYEDVDSKGISRSLKTLKDFQQAKGVILSKNFTQKPDKKSLIIRKNLTNKPFTDTRLISVIEKVIDDHFYRLCPYTKTTYNSFNIENLILDKYSEDEKISIADEVQFTLASVMEQINEFIGLDTWHFYFTQRRGNALVISKTVDYRIYDWYRMKWEAEGKSIDEEAEADIFSVLAG